MCYFSFFFLKHTLSNSLEAGGKREMKNEYVILKECFPLVHDSIMKKEQPAPSSSNPLFQDIGESISPQFMIYLIKIFGKIYRSSLWDKRTTKHRHTDRRLSQSKISRHTCINHTASLSALDIALYTAEPRDEMYVGSLVGGEFSLNVSLQPNNLSFKTRYA